MCNNIFYFLLNLSKNLLFLNFTYIIVILDLIHYLMCFTNMKKIFILSLFISFKGFGQTFEFKSNGNYNKNGIIRVDSLRSINYEEINAIESNLKLSGFNVSHKNPDYILIYTFQEYAVIKYFNGMIIDKNGDVIISFRQRKSEIKKKEKEKMYKKLAEELANFIK